MAAVPCAPPGPCKQAAPANESLPRRLPAHNGQDCIAAERRFRLWRLPTLAPPFRPATPDDAAALADLAHFASEGLALHVWTRAAGSAGDPWEIGRERGRRDTGHFSYRNGIVAETGGRVVAGLIGYGLPDRPEPIRDTIPALFVPLQQLENLASGTWYVNILAAYPDQRGKGYGAALLAVADAGAA